jgi:hypothetical protein
MSNPAILVSAADEIFFFGGGGAASWTEVGEGWCGGSDGIVA